jgi:UDP-N-acetylmuramoyl-tripeptide--D-alanyl-D-alanine ligase
LQIQFNESKEVNGRSTSSHSALDSRVEMEILSPGLHLAMNACAACAVAIALGVPLMTAGNSVAKFTPIGNRSRLEEVGEVYLIDDSYNSNPLSLQAGLNLLASLDCKGRRVAFLGDMLELGTISQKAHIDALSLCKQLNFDMIGLVGPLFSEAARSKEFEKRNFVFASFKNSEELAFKTAELLRPGDAVLVKGSRGMKMEMVASATRSMGRVCDHQRGHHHS